MVVRKRRKPFVSLSMRAYNGSGLRPSILPPSLTRFWFHVSSQIVAVLVHRSYDHVVDPPLAQDPDPAMYSTPRRYVKALNEERQAEDVVELPLHDDNLQIAYFEKDAEPPRSYEKG